MQMLSASQGISLAGLTIEFGTASRQAYIPFCSVAPKHFAPEPMEESTLCGSRKISLPPSASSYSLWYRLPLHAHTSECRFKCPSNIEAEAGIVEKIEAFTIDMDRAI